MAAPIKTMPDELGDEREVLFEVCVLQSVGSVFRRPGSKTAPDEAAYLLIAQHARTLPDNGSAEYRFPGHAADMFTTVTVTNETLT